WILGAVALVVCIATAWGLGVFGNAASHSSPNASDVSEQPPRPQATAPAIAAQPGGSPHAAAPDGAEPGAQHGSQHGGAQHSGAQHSSGTQPPTIATQPNVTPAPTTVKSRTSRRKEAPPPSAAVAAAHKSEVSPAAKPVPAAKPAPAPTPTAPGYVLASPY